MGLQLDILENTLIGPNFYRQLFPVHGTPRMSFFAVPEVGRLLFAPTQGGGPLLWRYFLWSFDHYVNLYCAPCIL